MSGTLLRILIVVAIFAAIAWGFRRIWMDWMKSFREEDKAIRRRDLQERKRADVIELKRSEDGVYRPPEEDGETRQK
jgi:hypothetical protein